MAISKVQACARLLAAPWVSQPEVQAVLAVLGGAEGKTRVVGGAVRDVLLGRPTGASDIDMASQLPPDAVSRRAEAAGFTVYPTGIDHGTVTVRNGDFTTEVTTLREDVETDGRHAVVAFGTDWVRDAERRDFTLNALYANGDGTLFDPLGGLDDCLAQRVRFIGDPDRRIAEDRLRVFRFFRFSASHGSEIFDAEGLAACRRAAGALGALSAERVGAEMLRMLGLPKIARTMRAMVEAKVLDLPMPVIAGLERYEALVDHPSQTGRLALIARAWGPAPLRERWRLSNRRAGAVEASLAGAALIGKGEIDAAFYRYRETFATALEITAVEAGWDRAHLERLKADYAARPAPVFPLTGGDLLAAGFKPGPEVGETLSRLEARWIESGFALDAAALLGGIGR